MSRGLESVARTLARGWVAVLVAFRPGRITGITIHHYTKKENLLRPSSVDWQLFYMRGGFMFFQERGVGLVVVFTAFLFFLLARRAPASVFNLLNTAPEEKPKMPQIESQAKRHLLVRPVVCWIFIVLWMDSRGD